MIAKGLLMGLLLCGLGCAVAPATLSPRAKAQLGQARGFANHPRPASGLFIWDSHAVPGGPLPDLVAAQLQDKGYQPTRPDQAGFWVTIRVFSSDRAPRRLILLVELVDPDSGRQLWQGQTEPVLATGQAETVEALIQPARDLLAALPPYLAK